MFKLTIKGTPKQALEQLSKRKLDGVVKMNPSSKHPEVFAYVSQEAFVEIGKWFNEPSDIIPGYGYPDGTLLHYQTINPRG